jgi:hypothetical protein
MKAGLAIDGPSHLVLDHVIAAAQRALQIALQDWMTPTITPFAKAAEAHRHPESE